MINEFRTDNTEGYTKEQLAALNEELSERLAATEIEEGTPEFYEFVKTFNDEVSRR